MSEEVHETMMKRAQEEDFIMRSKQAKKNKRGGSLDNVIELGHFQGSTSASEHARREAAKNGGISQKAEDIYLMFHSREQVPGKGKELVGSKEKQIMVVGGRKRGLIPCLGTVGDLLYEKSSNRSQRLQLEKQRLDMEAQRLQHEQERLMVEKEKLEETRKTNDYLAKMKMTMQEYRDASCRGPFDFPHSHDPRDLSGGGSAMC
ncbi:Myb/SANT-like DNA-binding domain-containing protein 4 [Bienertia sinuspersici]